MRVSVLAGFLAGSGGSVGWEAGRGREARGWSAAVGASQGCCGAGGGCEKAGVCCC